MLVGILQQKTHFGVKEAVLQHYVQEQQNCVFLSLVHVNEIYTEKLGSMYSTNTLMFLPGQILHLYFQRGMCPVDLMGLLMEDIPFHRMELKVGMVWPPPSGGFNYGEVSGFYCIPLEAQPCELKALSTFQGKILKSRGI